MLRTLRRVLVVLVLFEAVAIVVFRMRWRPVIDAIRQFNRRALNPVMLKMAGKRHWYASVVHHVGRKSGRAYATPVWAERVGRFFYIPLPYGTDVDWCRNLLAAGSATLESNGVNYRVAGPEIVSAEAAALHLSAMAKLRYSLFGVDHYLRTETMPSHQHLPATAG